MEATIFALAVGLAVSAFIVLAYSIRRSKENYALEAADLAQKIREQRARREKTASARRLVPVPAGPSIGEQVLSQVQFEKGLIAEALKIANREK